MNKFFLVLILFLTTELISQNNPELFELKLNISNIESSGNLVIAVWSNSDSWDNNMTNSSGQRIGFDYGFKEKVKKGIFPQQLIFLKEFILFQFYWTKT